MMSRPRIINLVLEAIAENCHKDAVYIEEYIERLEQELESARLAYEQTHRIYRGAEDECDELKTHNNELRQAAIYVIPHLSKGHLREKLESVVDTMPSQCLAEHDAEAIDQFIKEIEDLGFAVDTGYFESAWVIDIDRIKNRANQLRQKAQEISDDTN